MKTFQSVSTCANAHIFLILVKFTCLQKIFLKLWQALGKQQFDGDDFKLLFQPWLSKADCESRIHWSWQKIQSTWHRLRFMLEAYFFQLKFECIRSIESCGNEHWELRQVGMLLLMIVWKIHMIRVRRSSKGFSILLQNLVVAKCKMQNL